MSDRVWFAFIKCVQKAHTHTIFQGYELQHPHVKPYQMSTNLYKGEVEEGVSNNTPVT